MGIPEQKEEFKGLLAALDPAKPTQTNADTLEKLCYAWDKLCDEHVRVTEHLRGNIIYPILAKVLEENYEEFVNDFPGWIWLLVDSTVSERDLERELFPVEQLRVMVELFRKYLIAGCYESINAFRKLALFTATKQILLENDEVYDILKSDLNDYQLLFLWALTGSEQWSLKMLADHQLILNLIATRSNRKHEVDAFDVFLVLSVHSDAKTLLPKDVLVKVSESNYVRRTELCAMLCSEDDLKLLQLDSAFVSGMSDMFAQLLTKGVSFTKLKYYNLLDVIMPIGNLSVVEEMKEMLGNKFVPQFIQLLTEKLPDTMYTTKYITRAKQEASKALWNLAYLEGNRTRIASDNGLTKLNNLLASTNDPILKKNIAGILHMFTHNPDLAVKTTGELTEQGTKKHIMISYNWGNQPIVKRIAKELQGRGFNVWLDIEQMGGSTLEAMAAAIEHSELVLICMSQKYKDSPNCRLEGEYCVNRKVPYIPLMMQSGYRPDGWLGIALGSKLYYEFNDEENWEGKITELLKAIGGAGKSSSRIVAPLPSPEKQVVVEWTDSDLLQWMKTKRIDEHYELFKKHELTREALLELQRLHNVNNPQFFFSAFEKMGITEFGKILKLSAAIHSLK